MSAATTTPCPRCGNPASGNFCASCGSPLTPSTCRSCGASLAAGAKFCHKCGTPAGGEAAPRAAMGTVPAPAGVQTPWIIAGLLVLLTVAAVFYLARDRTPVAGPPMANAGNVLPGAAGAGGDPCTSTPGGRAPDISTMTLKEQFTRLNDRIMQAAGRGDTACVIRFWPMAQGAYQNLLPADRDVDVRYHMATLYLLVTQTKEANALADSIMSESPDNLFGYYVRASAAGIAGDSTKAKAARAAFREHFDAEIKKKRPEYTDHRAFLDDYLKGEGAH